MFCKNCGKELPEGTLFCSGCGQAIDAAPEANNAPVDQAPAQEAFYNQAPAQQEFHNQPPVDNNQNFATPEFDVMPKPKKKKGLAVLLSILAILVAGAVAVGVFWDPIKGFFIKNFGSDSDYFEYVAEKAYTAPVDNITKGYGAALDVLKATGSSDNLAAKISLQVNVGDSVIELLKQNLPDEIGSIDLSFLKNVSLDITENVDGDLTQLDATLNINGKELISANAILNLKEGKVFVSVPFVSDDYIEIPLGDEFKSIMSSNAISNMLNDEAFIELLPTEQELNSLITKYVEIVVENSKNVENSTEKITANGVTEKLTVMDITIDDKTVRDVVTAVLKAVKDDSQIKNIVEDYYDYMMSKAGMGSSDDFDVHESLKKGIDELLENIDELEFDETVNPCIYVNSDHEVAGLKLKAEGQELFYFASAQDGSDVGFELKCEGLTVIGKGTEKGGKLNGSYDVKFENTSVATIKVIDYKTDDEYLNGKIRILPSMSFLEDVMKVDLGMLSAVSLANPGIELGCESNAKSVKFDINLVSGDNLLLGYSISGEETASTSIKEPTNTVSVDDIEDWASNIDPDKIMSKLEDAGIPEEILSVFTMATMKNQAVESYDDYYDDSYDYNENYDFY